MAGNFPERPTSLAGDNSSTRERSYLWLEGNTDPGEKGVILAQTKRAIGWATFILLSAGTATALELTIPDQFNAFLLNQYVAVAAFLALAIYLTHRGIKRWQEKQNDSNTLKDTEWLLEECSEPNPHTLANKAQLFWKVHHRPLTAVAILALLGGAATFSYFLGTNENLRTDTVEWLQQNAPLIVAFGLLLLLKNWYENKLALKYNGTPPELETEDTEPSLYKQPLPQPLPYRGFLRAQGPWLLGGGLLVAGHLAYQYPAETASLFTEPSPFVGIAIVLVLSGLLALAIREKYQELNSDSPASTNSSQQ